MKRPESSPQLLSRHEPRERAGRDFPPLLLEFQKRWFGDSFDGAGAPRRRPGFTELTREVLRAGTSRRFRLESTLFGLVTLICAWPIVMMIYEVIRFLR